MHFIGIDLTSAYTASPRAIDVAVLDDSLHCELSTVAWPAAAQVVARDATALRAIFAPALRGRDAIWAVDGPQGLARPGASLRDSERSLGTPGRTPDLLPATTGGGPFQDYIRSSVDLFAGLLASSPTLRLAGNAGAVLADATLYEAFPGAEWSVLAARRLPKKGSHHGRDARRRLLARLGISGLPALPTADQNDALICAYLAWCTRRLPAHVKLVGAAPFAANGELREGFILHATQGQRLELENDEAEPGDALPAAGDSGGTEGVASSASEWSDDDTLRLRLSDYGVVHGKLPENAWLQPGVDYDFETVFPHPVVRFRLEHAPTFTGGLGWRAVPKVKPLLKSLGLIVPAHLSGSDSVTLRLRRI
jgi:hypothetical protein